MKLLLTALVVLGGLFAKADVTLMLREGAYPGFAVTKTAKSLCGLVAMDNNVNLQFRGKACESNLKIPYGADSVEVSFELLKKSGFGSAIEFMQFIKTQESTKSDVIINLILDKKVYGSFKVLEMWVSIFAPLAIDNINTYRSQLPPNMTIDEKRNVTFK